MPLSDISRGALLRLRKVTIGYSVAQAKTIAATANAPTTRLVSVSAADRYELAQLSFDKKAFDEIAAILSRQLKNQSKWRQVLKSLLVLKSCLEEGSERFVAFCYCKIDLLEELERIGYIPEDGKDRGIGIRRAARAILDLLDNPEILRRIRWHSNTIRSRKSSPSDKRLLRRSTLLRRGRILPPTLDEPWTETLPVTIHQKIRYIVNKPQPLRSALEEFHDLISGQCTNDEIVDIMEVLLEDVAATRSRNNWAQAFKSVIMLRDCLSNATPEISAQFEASSEISDLLHELGQLEGTSPEIDSPIGPGPYSMPALDMGQSQVWSLQTVPSQTQSSEYASLDEVPPPYLVLTSPEITHKRPVRYVSNGQDLEDDDQNHRTLASYPHIECAKSPNPPDTALKSTVLVVDLQHGLKGDGRKQDGLQVRHDPLSTYNPKYSMQCIDNGVTFCNQPCSGPPALPPRPKTPSFIVWACGADRLLHSGSCARLKAPPAPPRPEAPPPLPWNKCRVMRSEQADMDFYRRLGPTPPPMYSQSVVWPQSYPEQSLQNTGAISACHEPGQETLENFAGRCLDRGIEHRFPDEKLETQASVSLVDVIQDATSPPEQPNEGSEGWLSYGPENLGEVLSSDPYAAPCAADTGLMDHSFWRSLDILSADGIPVYNPWIDIMARNSPSADNILELVGNVAAFSKDEPGSVKSVTPIVFSSAKAISSSPSRSHLSRVISSNSPSSPLAWGTHKPSTPLHTAGGPSDPKYAYSVPLLGRFSVMSRPTEEPLVRRYSLPSVHTNLDLTGKVECIGTAPQALGGFSDVWKGTMDWQGSTMEVAVKILRAVKIKDSSSARERVQLRMHREVDLWKRLDHANVVPLCGFTLDGDGTPGLVCPWYSEGNVLEYLKKHLFADRKKIIRQIADGLAYLHCQDPVIVHADVKGQNILIDSEGNAAISDFGLSKIIQESPSSFSTSNACLGSVRWCSPERLNDDEHRGTPEADVWAFAALTLEIFTGKVPFHYYENEVRVMRALVAEDQIPLRKHYPELPADNRLWGILEACWRKNPAERPNMKELKKQIFDDENFANH